MQPLPLLCLCLLAMACLANAQYTAHARVYGTVNAPSVTGTVLFQQTLLDGDVAVTWNFNGLPVNSSLGFHVHTWGDLSSLDGTAAGGHYNPGNVSHGCFPSSDRHAGDLGNITTDANGASSGSLTANLMQVLGSWSIIGRAIVIHAQGDNCQNPTGNAGARLAVGAIGISSTSTAGVHNPNNTAVLVATLHGLNGNEAIIGTVHFTADSVAGRVKMFAQIYNVTANTTHGIHIHNYGDLSTLDGNAAGGHYNPFNKNHSYPNDPERHMGDMGNVTVDHQGKILVEQSFDLITLGGVNSIVGRAVILHASPDQGSANIVNGNAGARIALGVIGLSNATFPKMPVPTNPSSDAAPSMTVMLSAHFLLMIMGLLTYFF